MERTVFVPSDATEVATTVDRAVTEDEADTATGVDRAATDDGAATVEAATAEEAVPTAEARVPLDASDSNVQGNPLLVKLRWA